MDKAPSKKSHDRPGIDGYKIRLDTKDNLESLSPNRDTETELPKQAACASEIFRKWTVGDLIQSGIGLLLLITVFYSVRSYNLSLETRNMQLRSWLTISKLQFLDLPASPSEKSMGQSIHVGPNAIAIVLKNTGQTPALHVHMSTDPYQVQGTACKTDDAAKSPYTSTINLGPGDTAENDNFIFYMSQACLDALHQGVATIRLDGIVTYTTISGEEYHSRFCSQVEGQTSGMLTACAEGNDID